MVPEVLAAIDARPPRARLVVLSDFDGTLASFDVDPTAPRLSDETRHALETLAARRDVTVGLVSGRRVDDLDRRTQLPPHVYLAGLHGSGDSTWRSRMATSRSRRVPRACRSSCRRHQRAVRHRPGVKLEHKGVSVTVHVRAVEIAAPAGRASCGDGRGSPVARLGRAQVARRQRSGRVVAEHPWTKGDAVRWIVEDIETQRAAAGVVRLLRRRCDRRGRVSRRSVTGSRVVVGQRPSLARLRLNSPADVVAVLAHVNSNGHGKEHRR